jgi:transposase
VGTLSKLRRLVLRDKVSIRQASRQLGISRNTATRWLQEPEMVEPIYPTRQPPPGVLDAFKEQLSMLCLNTTFILMLIKAHYIAIGSPCFQQR